MTNLQKWQFYCKDLTSPDSFIEWGFYSMISSALQRRVWLGQANGAPLFLNQYIVFVADSGLGKGMVTRQINAVLKHHKQIRKVGGVEKEMFLIHMGPNATIYEQLIRGINESIAAFMPKNAPSLGMKGPYIHCSVTFNLEELGSLFRKHQEETIRFLYEGYDCVDYDYETKTQGKDNIRNSCVNLLAGTQPSFLSKIHADQLVNEGFGSRAIMLCEEAPRFEKFDPPEFSTEQFAALDEIKAHIKALTSLYGRVRFTDEALTFLRDWWETKGCKERINTSPKLKPYYARKKTHIQKVACAMHFGESTEMEVGIHHAKLAIEKLGEAETRMHLALSGSAKNPASEVADEILAYIKDNGPTGHIKLFSIFYNQCPDGKKTFDSALEFLAATGKTKTTPDKKVSIV